MLVSRPLDRQCQSLFRWIVTVVATAAVVLCPGVGVAAAAQVAAIEGTNGAAVPELEWGACAAESPEEEEFLRAYRCTTVEVPLSYRDPSGQSVELALGLLPASDPEHKIGTLFWNPGGPGGSGRIPPPFSAALHARFDIVGFDPRGVGASTQLRCFQSNEQARELLAWDFPITPAQERRVIELTRRATELCAENGGPLLGHVSTANVARDLDLLRQAVGDERLTYLGFSYGTHIGEVYANLFPSKVRALTLDGVVDPIEWTTGYQPADAFVPHWYRTGNFVGSDQALTTFLNACALDARCAFREPGVDLRGKYDRLLARLRRRPVDIRLPDGTPITINYQTAVYGTLGELYDPYVYAELADILQSVYVATEHPTAVPARVGARLMRAVQRARHAPLVGLLDEPDEPYLGNEAGSAVECADANDPSDPWVFPRYARRADRRAYPFGSPWVYFGLHCATWPVSDPDRYTGPWNRPTSNPLLLIGNRLGDPATPYEDAQRTAEHVLADARLLTLDAPGHVAFPYSGCVARAVERYLIDIHLPAAGTVCPPDAGPFDPPPESSPSTQRLRDTTWLAPSR
jgi:pimeloyl-ACP methyl ester carboxylesterase